MTKTEATNMTASIFKSCHATIDERRLLSYEGMNLPLLYLMGTDEESLTGICDGLGIERKHLFMDPDNKLAQTCYWDGLFYYSFQTLHPAFIFGDTTGERFSLQIDKQFKRMRELVQEAYNGQDWRRVLAYSDKKVSLLVYKHIMDRIPECDRKALFLEVYQRNEYGFDRLDHHIVTELLNLPTDAEHDIRLSGVTPDENGDLTIYRGVTLFSNCLDRSYSWTLEPAIAQFFAERFNSHGEIKQAKVAYSAVKAYLTDRGEAEVLVLPEDVRDIQDVTDEI